MFWIRRWWNALRPGRVNREIASEFVSRRVEPSSSEPTAITMADRNGFDAVIR